MLFNSSKKSRKISDSEEFRLSLLAGAAFLLVLPIIFVGIYNGVDLPQHFQLAVTFYKSILAGNFYPGWAAEENLGYGGLDVRFYPPLTAFLMAITRILSGSWHSATCINIFFFTFIGSLGVYCWAKEFISPKQAVWAGLAFIVMPYRLSEIYNGFVFAEYAGCSILSFSFLFVSRVCKRGRISDITGLAISFSILILTHLPLTIIGSISLSLYALFCLNKANRLKSIFKLSIAVLTALLATAVYWLKMVSELKWLRGTRFRTDNHFDYSYNYLLTSPWFGEKQLWYLNIILVTTFVLTIGFYVVHHLKTTKIYLSGSRKVFILFLFSIIMTVFVSQPVWMIIPYLAEVQFPWRWLTVSSLSASIIVGMGSESFWKLMQNTHEIRCDFALKAISLSAATLLIITVCITWVTFIGNYIDAPDVENWANQKSNSLGFDFFWTPQTKETTFDIDEKILAGDRKTTIISWQFDRRNFVVEAGDKSDIRVSTLFYPHWKALINNKSVDLQQAEDGAILVTVPIQKAEVLIWFEEPYYINWAIYTSILSWIILVALTFFNLMREWRFRAAIIK